jgi:hypothetical protein
VVTQIQQQHLWLGWLAHVGSLSQPLVDLPFVVVAVGTSFAAL